MRNTQRPVYGYYLDHTVDGINAELRDKYEQWGVTPDGRHCCTDCLNVTDNDRYATPDGQAAMALDGIDSGNVSKSGRGSL